jgi:hypothetical protein
MQETAADRVGWQTDRGAFTRYSTPMQHYRAFMVGDDGHFSSFRAFVCASDEDAIVWAKHLADGQAIELWNDERFVLRLEVSSSAAG